jgi:hypothetical protein
VFFRTPCTTSGRSACRSHWAVRPHLQNVKPKAHGSTFAYGGFGACRLPWRLGGYVGYFGVDQDATLAVPPASVAADGQSVGSQLASANQTEAVRLNALANRTAQGSSDGALDGSTSAQVAKPVSLASAGDTGALLAPPPPKANLEPHGRAYLFRGVAGLLYSRGMDSLADKSALG